MWQPTVRPLEPGEGWCLAAFPGGMYEFLVHPYEALWCVEHGVLVDGRRLRVRVVDRFPAMHAVLLQTEHEKEDRFIDSGEMVEVEAPPLRRVA